MRAGVRIIVIEEVRNDEKIVFIQNIVKNDWCGNASPAYPLDPPLSVCLFAIPGSAPKYSLLLIETKPRIK